MLECLREERSAVLGKIIAQAEPVFFGCLSDFVLQIKDIGCALQRADP